MEILLFHHNESPSLRVEVISVSYTKDTPNLKQQYEEGNLKLFLERNFERHVCIVYSQDTKNCIITVRF